MKVLVTDQIRQADAYTITHEPVLSLDLMERAARAVADALEPQLCQYRAVRIFAGFGNNGGDGIALARMLTGSGLPVYLHLLLPEKTWSPDAEANIHRLPESDTLVVTRMKEVADLPLIQPGDVLIDSLFGSGLTREPDGFPAMVIDHINASGCPVVSIDIPSGLFGEDNRLNSRKHVVRASQTLTFQFPKLSFFSPENTDFVGDWRVLPIGLHPDFIESVQTPWHAIDPVNAAGWLKPRGRFSHKGTYGHALIIAGSAGKTGAGVLAVTACLRSGSGLTTALIPEPGNAVLPAAVPEAMTLPDAGTNYWTSLPSLTPYTAIGVGPGIGVHPETWSALRKLMALSRLPLVLDADALNLLALHPGSLLQVPKNSILTPHPGEYKRLFGEDPDDYINILRIRDIAMVFGLVLVRKGAHTAVAGPDGSVWFNTTGNPGMATGGSGDVLTGIITGLCAQGYDPFTAARLGVYLHGLAGDIAAAEIGQEALIARDIIDSIGKAYLRIHTPIL